MKNIFYLFIILGLGACKVSNTSLNDNNKAKNAKLVAVNQPANFLRTKFLDNGTDIRIFVSFLTNDSLDIETFKAKYSGTYALVMDYAQKDKAESRILPINLNAISSSNRNISFYFDIPKPKTDLIQFTVKIELSERGSSLKLQNELTVRTTTYKTADIFGLFKKNSDQLMLGNYVHASDSVIIKSLDNKPHKFTLVRYKHDFDAALSPLAVGQKPTPKPLFVDSLLQIDTNTPFVLGQEGMYYFIKDTTDRSGFCVLSVDDRFPRYTKPVQLAKPLVYLTTNQEYNNLSNTTDARRSFEQFWLSLYNGNQQAAKKTIKSLYHKVEEANMMFTGYKEGWKTDKGMVYIVMGRPDNVRFLKDKEVWVYTRNAKFSEINFTFTKRPNQFIEDHYELSRFAEFQPIWFPAVEQWRSGEHQ